MGCRPPRTSGGPDFGDVLGIPFSRPLGKDPAIAEMLASRYGCAVLLKGGHDTTHKAVDILHMNGRLYTIATPAVEAPLSTHGTGCSLSAAITASLANGRTLLDAVREGKAYIYEAIRTGCHVGKKATVLGIPKQLPLGTVKIQTL